MGVRTGIDLVQVQHVADSVAEHGDAYLERVYTDRERAECEGRDGLDPARLATRFAAKEAAFKALGPGDEAIPWRSIEVVRDTAGRVELALTGRAAELAREAGVTELALSLTHEGPMAAAIVVAEIGPSRR